MLPMLYEGKGYTSILIRMWFPILLHFNPELEPTVQEITQKHTQVRFHRRSSNPFRQLYGFQ